MFCTNFFIFYIISVRLMSTAWDADDLSLFDVVEDVNRNFYELLEIDQSASQSDIRRAYRKVSLQLHPDKNKDPDAENQFRKLVAAYEVLKDEKMRLKYNDILVNGLPDWRQPVYYYRRVRKMGLLELSVLLSVILTVGHFLVIWSMYLERKFELEEIFRSKKKKDKKSKKQKSNNPGMDDDNDVVTLPSDVECLIIKPKILDLLPFLFLKGIYTLFINLPHFTSVLIDAIKAKWFSKPVEESDDEDGEEDEDGKFKQKRPRPVNQFVYEMAEPSDVLNYTKLSSTVKNDDAESLDHGVTETEKKSDWTESDTEMLVKAIVKFPGGTVDRWEKIAALVGRSVKEVTAMSKRLKSSTQHVMSEMNNKVITKRHADQLLQNVELTLVESDDSQTTTAVKSSTTASPKPKTVTNPTPNSRHIERTLMIAKQNQQSSTSSSVPQQQQQPSQQQQQPQQQQQQLWNQQQQKQLEVAMVQISKDIPDRWARISELVPGKTKDECLQRVKYLAEMVKKRKMSSQLQQGANDHTTS